MASLHRVLHKKKRRGFSRLFSVTESFELALSEDRALPN